MLNIIASIQNGYALSNASTSKPWSLIEKTSDQALIDSIAVGDKNAMQVLFARHKVRVYRFVLHLVGDASVAEDVISDVFLDVWRHADRFEARSSVQTWLLAIARYKALSALRSRSYEVLDENAAAAIEDPADNPEVAQLNDRSAIVRRCLKQLSPAHQEIIDLVYYHEKSVQEVSEIVGIPGNTVKTRMFYARRQLSELLEAQGVVGASS
jgi:RNA polymerase sigma-70 factor, ECF subfamily